MAEPHANERNAQSEPSDVDVAALERQIAEWQRRVQREQARAGALRGGLESVLSSPAWRLVHKLRRAREKLAPYGSWRARVYWWIVDLIFRRPPELRGMPGPLGGAKLTFPGGPKALLRDILALTGYPEGIVVFPPIVDWGWMRQRPHQFALEFEKAGYLVFYCPPQSRTDFVPDFRQISHGLFLCGCIEWLYELPDAIVVMGKPQHWEWVRHFRSRRIVYDYFDDLGLHSHDGRTRRRELALHERMLREADVVAVTAERLIEGARRTRPDALLCPNGVDFEHFHRDPPPTAPAELQKIKQRGQAIVGYHGALASWFDFALLREAAKRRPHVTFVLIGPDYDGAAERERPTFPPNIRWLDELPYEELPAYVHAFDVAMIPFVLNEITLATNPIKLFEYFAAGKPVVTTPLPECRKYSSVHIADSADAFVAAIDRALAEAGDVSKRSAAIELAKSNSWAERVRTIIERLDGGRGEASR
ncbi:MAG: glycosyltransferase [Phycisphaerae bacterium]|nr:glycosyltransferase [Phycisphaerae bacterium]